MGAAAAVASKDLRQRWRDRSALTTGVLAPLLLTFLISLAFGRGTFEFSATYAVADLDGGPLARTLVTDVLGGPDLAEAITVDEVASAAEAEALVEDGDADAAFVLAPGFSEAAQGTSPLPIEVVRRAAAPYASDVAEAIATGYMASLDAVRLSVVAALQATGAPPTAEEVGRLGAEAAARPGPIDVAEVTASEANRSPGAIFAPAMAVFFLYYVAALGARSLVAERTTGTFSRLLAAPVRPTAILTGKVAGTFVLGVWSIVVTAVVSTFLVDADWGPPLPSFVVMVATVAAVTGVTALVLTVGRTEQQIGLLMSIVTFGFALLGGNFVSLAQAPPFLQRISLLTPNGQALRAFQDLAIDRGGLASVAGPVLVLLGFAAATFGLAAARRNRLVAP